MKNSSVKNTIIVILSFVALVVLIATGIIRARAVNKANERAAEVTAEETTETTEGENKELGGAAEASTEEAEPVDENGFTAAQKEEYIKASQATFDDDVTKEISVNDDKGDQERKIGNYYVKYNGSYATSGSILLDTYKINMIIYNDGNKDDIKGYIIAYPLMENMEKPETIEQCQSILSEYIPAGTGVASAWEETDNFFIRMLSGYSSADSAGVITYTFVPKRIEEGNIYQVIFSASKSGTTITPISKESFASAVDAIHDAVSDSKIFVDDYDSIKESLVDIAYYETSTTDSLGGITELAAAHRNYLETVYGTTDLDSLTEEEIEEKYWKYNDPRGYAEYQYYENGIGELDEDGNVIVGD